MPVQEKSFRKLAKVSNKTRRIGKKVDWSILRAFLAKNKHLAYRVGEVLNITNDIALLKGATSISRVRVYKELEKYVKKGYVDKRFEEDSNVGLYMWRHIEKKETVKPTVPS